MPGRPPQEEQRAERIGARGCGGGAHRPPARDPPQVEGDVAGEAEQVDVDDAAGTAGPQDRAAADPLHAHERDPRQQRDERQIGAGERPAEGEDDQREADERPTRR